MLEPELAISTTAGRAVDSLTQNVFEVANRICTLERSESGAKCGAPNGEINRKRLEAAALAFGRQIASSAGVSVCPPSSAGCLGTPDGSMGDTGLEIPAENQRNSSNSETGGAKSGAMRLSPQESHADDLLNRMMSKLKTLSEDQRRAMEALVNSIG